jgi:uncharacterized protein YbjT (DUF2867 family)
MSNVLVTAGTGHLGRNDVQLLLARADELRVLARSLGSDSR